MRELARLVRSFPKRRILLVGDLILDVYHRGSAIGISAETPTVVVRAETAERSWGGAGLVCRNVLALGAQVTFVSVLGDDAFATHETDLAHPNLTKVFLCEPGRMTTVKERFWTAGHKLLQWDHLDNRPIGAVTQRAVLAAVGKHLPAADALVVLDARHGLISPRLAAALVRLARRTGRSLYVDSQVSQREANHSWYRGATVVSLNQKEATVIDPRFTSTKLERSAARLSRVLGVPNVVVKLGGEGAAAWTRGRYCAAPAAAVTAVDTTGAGDAFLAALALAGPDISRTTLRLANLWAGLATEILGTQPPKLVHLTRRLVA